MSGFSYPKPIFNSDIYNPLFYLSLDPSGFLTLDYANTLYLPKNDYRLSYISGITNGIAQSGIALVPDSSLNISGINALSCASLSIGGSLIDLSPLSYLNGITIGSASASKALVLDASKNITGINSLSATTLTGTLSTAIQSNITQVGTLTGLTVSGTLNATTIQQGGTTYDISRLSAAAGTATASKALIVDASKNITGINSLTTSTLNASGITSTGINTLSNFIVSAGGGIINGGLSINDSGISMLSGDFNLPQTNAIQFCRTVGTVDLNSSIYCNGIIGLVLSASRGSGNIQYRTNRYGTSNTLPSHCFTDGTVSSIDRGIMNLYYNKTVQIGGIQPTTTMLDAYWGLGVIQAGIQAHGYYSSSDSVGSAFIKPKYVWRLQNGAQGTDSVSQGGIGPHDTTGNRTRIGLCQVLSTADANNNMFSWDSSNSGVSLYAAGFTQTSDIRLKSSITKCEYGLQEILQMNSCRYILNNCEDDGYKLGFIAQEMQYIIPEALNFSTWEEHDDSVNPIPMGIEYSNLIPVLVNAIQQLNQKVEQQQRIINEISNKIFNTI